jgi:hypothetical protein
MLVMDTRKSVLRQRDLDTLNASRNAVFTLKSKAVTEAVSLIETCFQ